ncbi:MAG TPA: SAM-dependent chlorinase/fluorinase [Kiloniellaceae bacterium]|nr:SAM-dependent chlorinase/fluorinase [Kiloniellaceae bacterium]
MIVLFTDFGQPYVGQMHAVLQGAAPGVPVVELCTDLPAWNRRAAAYLLPAFAAAFPTGSVFLAVVDPGVGSARAALALRAEGRWFVGPDNGLLGLVARRAGAPACWEVTWRPERLSASFHGRDLFAPVAARLAGGATALPAELGRPIAFPQGADADWPDDLAEVVYVDGFGNVVTGLRAACLPDAAQLAAGGRLFPRARTFSDLAPGAAFWYENANGLAEIAVNRGRAADILELAVGDGVSVI